MSTSASAVRFAQRPDRSLILGLSATRAVTLGSSIAAVAAVTVYAGIAIGAIVAIGFSPLAGSALLTVEGRALIEWTPDAAHYMWRTINGRLTVLAKPGKPTPAGVLPIPGTGAALTALETDDGTVILRDKTADTWTVVASVTAHGFLYADGETQDAASAGWGRALAALGSSGEIQRIHVIHKTQPRSHAAKTPDNGATPAARIYRETLEQHTGQWQHHTLVALTVGGKAGRAAIRRAGRGLPAAARVLAAHRASAHDILAAADLTLDRWLSPDDLADWIIDAFDPDTTAITTHRSGIDTPATGPMAVTETWSTVHTDSAWHQALWVSNWPRFDTHPAFLAPLILPTGTTVTTSLIFEPIPTQVALRQIGRDKTAQASDAALRRRSGTLETAAQAARAADTLQRETDIAAGHVDMRHTALITVTADSPEALTEQAMKIRQAAAAAGCDTRVLYGQQLAALNATVIPGDIRL